MWRGGQVMIKLMMTMIINTDDDGYQECDHGNVGESAGVQADAEEGRESQPQAAAQVLTLCVFFLFIFYI